MNDIHVLNTETSTWTRPRVGGVLPMPRAGCTFTALRGRLYLFGGSGTSAKCFQDLQILDRQEMAWLDVSQYDESTGRPRGNDMGYDNDENRFHFGGSNMYGEPRSTGNNFGDNRENNDGPVQVGYEEERPNPVSLQQPIPMQGVNDPLFFRMSPAEWPSRDNTVRPRGAGGPLLNGSPNPNDEDTVPTVLVQGRCPGRRAGHTSTAVNRKIYVFGGSCGSDYLNDFFVLDTDPPPRAIVSEPSSLELVERRLRHFFNDEEFSDVTFVVQGQRVHGHRLVLSIVSDCFRAMFTNGFRESEAMEIEIPDCTHTAFLAVMEYIYTGALPKIDLSQDQDRNLGRVVEMLELADRFFLDHLKQICETILQQTVNAETVEYLLGVAQKTNAYQLQSICEHFSRNREGLT